MIDVLKFVNTGRDLGQAAQHNTTKAGTLYTAAELKRQFVR